jgi:hypothetical protein
MADAILMLVAVLRAATGTVQAPLSAVVWVNSNTKVYHCPGSPYYGHSRDGQYMSEAAARARGNRAAQGQGCPGSGESPGRLRPPTPGEVWINTETLLYYCPGSRYYGVVIRRGRFLPEGEARAAGARPAGGRRCNR